MALVGPGTLTTYAPPRRSEEPAQLAHSFGLQNVIRWANVSQVELAVACTSTSLWSASSSPGRCSRAKRHSAVAKKPMTQALVGMNAPVFSRWSQRISCVSTRTPFQTNRQRRVCAGSIRPSPHPRLRALLQTLVLLNPASGRFRRRLFFSSSRRDEAKAAFTRCVKVCV